MNTFEQKCAEFEANYNRLRVQRDNWQQIMIDEVLPRLGGMTPEEFISKYHARESRKLIFEVGGGNQAKNLKHGITLTVTGQKRKVVYVRKHGCRA